MHKKHKIITCVGYGNTGSSAGTNFFEEFSNVKSMSNELEFHLLFGTDGIGDLHRIIKEGNWEKTNRAINRFINFIDETNNSLVKKTFNNNYKKFALEFIDEIVSVKWKGFIQPESQLQYHSTKHNLRYSLAKRIFEENCKKSNYKSNLYEADTWKPNYQPFANQFFSFPTEEVFINSTKKFITKLLEAFDPDYAAEYIIIDQFIPSTNSQQYLCYFDDIKVIIIDRDPRELYVGNKIDWGNRWIPTDSVDKYINWFRRTRQHRLYPLPKNVFYCQFEDLVFNYEKTSLELIKFTGLSEHFHTKKKSVFIPEKSKKNTMLHRKYTNYASDIALIEKELPDFLYNYPESIIKETKNELQYSIFENLMNQADEVYLKENLNSKEKLILFDIEISNLLSSTLRMQKNINLDLLFSIAKFPYNFIKIIHRILKKEL